MKPTLDPAISRSPSLLLGGEDTTFRRQTQHDPFSMTSGLFGGIDIIVESRDDERKEERTCCFDRSDQLGWLTNQVNIDVLPLKNLTIFPIVRRSNTRSERFNAESQQTRKATVVHQSREPTTQDGHPREHSLLDPVLAQRRAYDMSQPKY